MMYIIIFERMVMDNVKYQALNAIVKFTNYFPLKIKATTCITIPHGCSVHLTNHPIHSDFTLRIAPEAIHFEWDFNPANLPDSAKLLEGMNSAFCEYFGAIVE